MKANGTKRKIFNDAVDLLAGAEEVSAPENGIRMLPIDSIRPFRKHPFRLYEGERLEDMVESIREHGVLNPVIVWQEGDGYEMLAGHNRQMAGKLAGLAEIPAIVKTDLTEEEAYVYVIETNVIQRGFAELLPSEKAAVLAERYEKVSSQGRRNDILEEIARLNGQDTAGTCGHDVHRLKSRDAIGEEYGMTGRNIARYMRVQQLEEPLKERLDEGTLPLVAAVDLSYLSEKEQKVVSGLAEKGKIRLDAKTAKCVRGMAGSVTEKRVLETLDDGKGKKDSAGKSVKLPADVYEKYFAGVRPADVAGIVEEALAAWFGKGGEGMQMFRTEEIEKLDKSYFNIILAENYDVTIQSKNTGHIWYIHNPEYPGEGECIIFHKHRASQPYHQHGRARSLGQAVRSIMGHDVFQMNGRKRI